LRAENHLLIHDVNFVDHSTLLLGAATPLAPAKERIR